MIRLTELRCSEGSAVLKLEGYLTQDTVDILSEILGDYAQRRVVRIQLNADGLATLDRIAVARWQGTLPSIPVICFHTSRKVLKRLLESCGLSVVFEDSG